MVGVKRKAEVVEKKAEVAVDEGGAKRVTEAVKKKAGGGGGPGKAKVAKKQITVVPDDYYDDKEFDLQRLMEMQSRQVSQLGPEQMNRYEFYRKSDLKQHKIKKLLTSRNLIPVTIPPSDPFIIAVKGLAKVFVGEIVENALDIQKEWGDAGALHPKHLREAYRRMDRDGNILHQRKRTGFPLQPRN
ncbi:hypothetical protein NDN08_008238 [Rhodosorus marinus]|uniref:TAFII28-like protein domain-containing protein n=1 Tax=Rhodosorus marinus TaxID=101924 RepID=A0AAV8V065_9RHOD|nr:hypothetical protein NDN08_008238 [Rhodosorus marinus]